jgi:hypothetical protein
LFIFSDHPYATRIPFENLYVNRYPERTGLQSGILQELFYDQLIGKETKSSHPGYAMTGDTGS